MNNTELEKLKNAYQKFLGNCYEDNKALDNFLDKMKNENFRFIKEVEDEFESNKYKLDDLWTYLKGTFKNDETNQEFKISLWHNKYETYDFDIESVLYLEIRGARQFKHLYTIDANDLEVNCHDLAEFIKNDIKSKISQCEPNLAKESSQIQHNLSNEQWDKDELEYIRICKNSIERYGLAKEAQAEIKSRYGDNPTNENLNEWYMNFSEDWAKQTLEKSATKGIKEVSQTHNLPSKQKAQENTKQTPNIQSKKPKRHKQQDLGMGM